MDSDSERVSTFLAKAGLKTPPRLAILQRQPDIPLRSTSTSDNEEATWLLASQRVSQPGYKPPSGGFRGHFSSKRLNKASDQSNWTFSKHEVACAINSLLAEPTLQPVGIARALLLRGVEAGSMNLEDLWQHRHAPESKNGKLLGTLKTQKRQTADTSELIPWLDHVTTLENLDYIRLFCSAVEDRKILDKAVSIALSQRSIAAMEILLSYGADASGCKDQMRERTRLEDIEIVQLLLAAPRVLKADFWRDSLLSVSGIALEVLSICLRHVPDAITEQMLTRALESEDYSSAAVLLAYTNKDKLAQYDHLSAYLLVSTIVSSQTRHSFLALLGEAGLLSDHPVLRQELLDAVHVRDLSRIEVLAAAGVSPDSEPHNALKLAVTRMDFETLDLLWARALPSSTALDWVPEMASQEDVLRLLDTFSSYGLAGDSLSRRLVVAAERGHVEEIEVLLRLGASVHFENMAAIRAILQSTDIAMLKTLVGCSHDSNDLGTLMPAIMKMQPNSRRLEALDIILDHGVPTAYLADPLATLMTESTKADLDHVRLLLTHGAPPDASDHEATNSVLLAASKGDFDTLKLVCEGSVRASTLSRAMPLAFAALVNTSEGYDSTIEVLSMLLSKGAKGVHIDQTLLSATIHGSHPAIIRLLLSHGADANYEEGLVFLNAVHAVDLDLFTLLCDNCPPSRASTERVLTACLEPQVYTTSALETLLRASPEKQAALDAFDPAVLQANPNMAAIVKCLLRHGLSVESRDGEVFRLAIDDGNISLLRDIIAAQPSIASLQRAFEHVSNTNIIGTLKLEMMEFLLGYCRPAEIGQTMCLLTYTQLAINGESTGLDMILRYGALVDHDGGAALRLAAAEASLDVLSLLLEHDLAVESIRQACLSAAASFASRKDISDERQTSTFEVLLDAAERATGEELSNLLLVCVDRTPEYTRLPAMLLERGAQVDIPLLRVAAEKASQDLFGLLVATVGSQECSDCFQYAQYTEMSEERRAWIFQSLLQHDISAHEKSLALTDSLIPNRIGDLTIPRLLLRSGAEVTLKALTLAIEAQSVEAMQLLCQRLNNREVADYAFVIAIETSFGTSKIRFEMYQAFLERGLISKAGRHKALLVCLEQHGADLETIRLLVTKGADPNGSNAECFMVACRSNLIPQFRELSKRANPDLVLGRLIGEYDKESDVNKWFKLCLEEQSTVVRLANNGLLFDCIRKFPSGTTLLSKMLRHGLSISVTTQYSMCPGWEEEECSLLIWTILAAPRIENKTIITLLKSKDAKGSCYLDFTDMIS